MVDDEPGCMTQAVRTETRAIAVAGRHQEVDVLGDRPDHLSLHSSPEVELLGILATEPRRTGSQQLQGCLVRNVFHSRGRPSPGANTTQQAG